MTASAKIRTLLGILCATFLLTGVIVKNTFTPRLNLTQTATTLERNLHGKEEYVAQLINDKPSLDLIKQLSSKTDAAIDFILKTSVNKRILVYTYRKNHLTFWSGVKILPPSPAPYKQGSNFVKLNNGYYEAIRKTDGDFTVLFFIPVKLIYPYQNKYLINGFDKDLLDDNNLEIADFTDKAVADIHNINHSYLFSVKLKSGAINYRFFYLDGLLFALGFITLCVLVHSLCSYMARTGYTLTAIGLLGVFIVVVRFINLYFNWPELSEEIKLFSPRLYSSNDVFPTLGDFCINLLAFTWLASFIYHHRFKIIKESPRRTSSYLLMIGFTAIMVTVAQFLLQLFYGLIINSNISFDVSNVFNLSPYSFVGVIMLCFSFLTYYLLNDAFLVIAKRLEIPVKHKVIILIAFMLGATALTVSAHSMSIFFLLVGLFTFIRLQAIWFNTGKLIAGTFIALIGTCAMISAVKLNYFQEVKEHETRKNLLQRLEASDDVTADEIFKSIELQIKHSDDIVQYFKDTARNTEYLKNRLQKLYFDDYLSKYDFKLYLFTPTGAPFDKQNNYELEIFRDMVATSAFKVSQYFYRENDNFGFQNYFAIIPIITKNTQIGSIVITLHSKPLFTKTSFPQLFVPGEIKTGAEYSSYSYAFYNDKRLVNQSGRYVYSLYNYNFKGQLKKYTFSETPITNPRWYKPLAHYSHLVYQRTPLTLIVVSHEEDIISQSVTSLTFFFVIFLAFSIFIIFSNWAWTRIRIFHIKNQRLKWGFRINVDKILYRSRIQFSVIFTVVITLILFGAITFQTISLQYKEQQDEMIRDKLLHIGTVFETGLQKGLYSTTHAGQVKFNEFADTYSADLTLYDYNGVALLSTQPKIYDYGILSRRMNGRAYIQMRKMQKSELLSEERLGNLVYRAAYVPIRDANRNTVAFLQLPYFSNQEDYNVRIGPLLNTMINIYALVFVAIGLIAVIIARQITAPLSFIQYNLSRTSYGQHTEPIVWHRDDEIGALVREYNNMIAELEKSAQRLAQSERENAWREMAKQVAHEIKNPLTPLKLGLQLLDKAWKDKDPKFDQKFERFSKSFVEQIESLSSIASEFSAFAKMPETRVERLNVFEIISQAVIIFRQMDNVVIDYQHGESFFINADRDQLLRCFNNLLKNAIEAVPPHRSGHITINYSINNKNILIIVTDNGNGIPENLRERIFEPNFTTKSSGTGLGLAFVKNSIENADGKIWFETQIGQGTTFYLSLAEAR